MRQSSSPNILDILHEATKLGIQANNSQVNGSTINGNPSCETLPISFTRNGEAPSNRLTKGCETQGNRFTKSTETPTNGFTKGIATPTNMFTKDSDSPSDRLTVNSLHQPYVDSATHYENDLVSLDRTSTYDDFQYDDLVSSIPSSCSPEPVLPETPQLSGGESSPLNDEFSNNSPDERNFSSNVKSGNIILFLNLIEINIYH